MKILPMVSTRWNEFRSFTEKKNKYHLYLQLVNNWEVSRTEATSMKVKSHATWWVWVRRLAISNNYYLSDETLDRRFCLTENFKYFFPRYIYFSELFTTQSHLLTTLRNKPFETSIFSFSHNVFYPSQTKFQIFSRISFGVCNCLQFRPV